METDAQATRPVAPPLDFVPPDRCSFAEWFRSQPLTAAQIAKELGCHRVTVYKYIAGTVMPRFDAARYIFQLTGGAVTRADLADAYEQGYRPRHGEGARLRADRVAAFQAGTAGTQA